MSRPARWCGAGWDNRPCLSRFSEELIRRIQLVQSLLAKPAIDNLSAEDARRIYACLHSSMMPNQRFHRDEQFVMVSRLQTFASVHCLLGTFQNQSEKPRFFVDGGLPLCVRSDSPKSYSLGWPIRISRKELKHAFSLPTIHQCRDKTLIAFGIRVEYLWPWRTSAWTGKPDSGRNAGCG